MSKQSKQPNNLARTEETTPTTDRMQPVLSSNKTVYNSPNSTSKKKNTWNTTNLLPQRSNLSITNNQKHQQQTTFAVSTTINGTTATNNTVLDPNEFPVLGAKPNKNVFNNQQSTSFNQTVINANPVDFPSLTSTSLLNNKTNTMINNTTSIVKLEEKEEIKIKKTSSDVKKEASETHNVDRERDSENYGILKISKLIKNKDLETNIYRFGTELKNLGTNINSNEELCLSHLTPWSDINQYQYNVRKVKSADRNLPECYTLPPLQPATKMIDKFSDETLFYLFYKMPRTLLQDAAAQELFNRNWRFHKTIRKWVTKDITNNNYNNVPSLYEKSNYIFFEPEIWEKVEKSYTLTYDSLEDRSVYMNNIVGNNTLGSNEHRHNSYEPTSSNHEPANETHSHFLSYNSSCSSNNVHSSVLHNK